ncbi:MAG: TVP38/TMEM64 family protein [Desulfovibrio sp.]
MSVKSYIKPILKGLIMLGTLGGIAYAFQFMGVKELLEPEWFDAHIHGKGMMGIMIYLGLSGAFIAVGMPRQLISFMAGYAFGPILGTLLGALGTTVGSAISLFYGRFIARSFVAKYTGKRMEKVENFIRRSPFNMALVIRFMPVGSNLLTNLAVGVSNISAGSFLAGSFLGFIPQTLVFALFGSGINVSSNMQLVLSVVLFVISSVIGVWMYRRYRDDVE